MASIKSPYDERTKDTRKRIQGTRENYYYNKYYPSCEGAFYWYENTKGYLHIIRPCTILVNGVFSHYVLRDTLLTVDNMLKCVGDYGYYNTIEEVKQAIENNIAKDN